MRRPSGLTRFLWRLTVLVQLVVPSVVSVADAQLERDALSVRAFSHVEANSSKDCVRVHPADCALCQHLTTPLAKADKPAPPVSTARLERPAVALGVARVASGIKRPTLPRAPPAF
ncbi:MAG TPA: hypothetical protein VM076_09075 [Gemmatimonadaceae bacterium]|nr:hypothetical protein [Gemmatimonadaceae bacterium]